MSTIIAPNHSTLHEASEQKPPSVSTNYRNTDPRKRPTVLASEQAAKRVENEVKETEDLRNNVQRNEERLHLEIKRLKATLDALGEKQTELLQENAELKKSHNIAKTKLTVTEKPALNHGKKVITR